MNNRAKHPDLFRVNDDIIKKIDLFFVEEKANMQHIMRIEDIFIFNMLTKCVKSMDAVLILANEGYIGEGMVVLRSILETVIAMKYITVDKRSKILRFNRFIHYDAIDKFKQSKKVYNLNDRWKNTLEQADFTNLKKFYKVSKRYFKKGGRIMKDNEITSWDGIGGIYNVSKARGVGLEEEYRCMYWVLSEFAHRGLQSMEGCVKKDGNSYEMSPKPSDEQIDVLLISSARYLGLAFGIVLKMFFGDKNKDKILKYALNPVEIDNLCNLYPNPVKSVV